MSESTEHQAPEANLGENLNDVDRERLRQKLEEKGHDPNLVGPAPQADEPAPEPPSLEIPEKFKRDTIEASLEAVLESYQNLEKMKGKGSQETAPLDDIPKFERPVKPETPDVEFDFDAAVLSALDNGIDDALKAKLAAAKVPQKAFDMAVEGQRAQMKVAYYELKDALGGDEAIREIHAAATENLSDSELAEVDSVLQSGNRAAMRGMMRDIADRFEIPVGRARTQEKTNVEVPDIVQPSATTTPGSAEPFGSQQEMLDFVRANQGKPGYDEQFTARLKASKPV